MRQYAKAVACVVQDNSLLCFKHPYAGNQIPKGTVEPQEDLSAAAIRELREEAGIDFTGIAIPIGVLERIVGAGPHEDGPLEKHLWHLFLMPATGLPLSWRHTATGSPAEEGLVFEFFWQPLNSSVEGFSEIFRIAIDRVRDEILNRFSSAPILSVITYLPAVPEDFEDLVTLRIEAMRESLERIGRFDPVRARERFRSNFAPEHTRHILIGDKRAGFFAVKPETNTLLLHHLYIRAGLQGKGIGTVVLKQVFAEADGLALPVRVGALRESDSNRFYSRHGFQLVEQSEFDNYYIRPSAKVL